MADDDTTQTVQTPEVKTYSQEYVTDLRNESARYRTERNTIAADTKAALEAEFAKKEQAYDAEVTRLTDLVGQSWIGAEKINAAVAVLFPEEVAGKISALANILTGVDATTIRDSAANAKALFGIDPSASSTPTFQRAVDPTQGAGAGQPPVHALNSDGLLKSVLEAING